MTATPVSKLYAEWREYEDRLNTLDTEEDIAAGLKVQGIRERRMLLTPSETLADLAMKLVTLTDEGNSELGDRLEELVEEAMAIIDWTPRPGTLERRRRWEEAEAARIAAC